ncbi:MAG: hypothetical protein IKY76_05865 [Alistipes sp.]|nr:hypothetical protein [Alistipes sp.]
MKYKIIAIVFSVVISSAYCAISINDEKSLFSVAVGANFAVEENEKVTILKQQNYVITEDAGGFECPD